MGEPLPLNLSNLAPAEGSTKKKVRVGRGIGSGLGKTCGRGVKGQTSRQGKGRPRGFEGGQNPLHRRVPKFGFNRAFRLQFEVVNISHIENHFNDGDTVDPEQLASKRLIRHKTSLVKLLGEGKLSKKLTVKAHKFSKSAIQKVNQAGGSTEEIKIGSR